MPVACGNLRWPPDSEAQRRSLSPEADEAAALAAPRSPVTALAGPGGLACHPRSRRRSPGGYATAPLRTKTARRTPSALPARLPVLSASPARVRPSVRPGALPLVPPADGLGPCVSDVQVRSASPVLLNPDPRHSLPGPGLRGPPAGRIPPALWGRPADFGRRLSSLGLRLRQLSFPASAGKDIKNVNEEMSVKKRKSYHDI